MSDILERANAIGKDIHKIAKEIDSAFWVKTGKHIDADDLTPEIVAAVIYLLEKLNEAGPE